MSGDLLPQSQEKALFNTIVLFNTHNISLLGFNLKNFLKDLTPTNLNSLKFSHLE